MVWAVGVLSFLLVVFFILYKKALSETNAMRSMFIMAVLYPPFLQSQQEKIRAYMNATPVRDAMDLSIKFNAALDNMAVGLMRGENSILLGAHAALWTTYKAVKEKNTI